MSTRPKSSLTPQLNKQESRLINQNIKNKSSIDSKFSNRANSTSKLSQVKRPQTNLAIKRWRAAHFHSGAPASRREVELLGEWLNSVLADNIENNENPLDIVTNAQHWFSVAFNELVRQVSITCAERGRLIACIWKRNQDLFQKLVEIQRTEREYILKCHKDRIQFLKTDFEFCNSRLKTIEETYEEEQDRWKDNREKDISKFDNLQQKIDQQIQDRKQLQQEISTLEQRLGIESHRPNNNTNYNEKIFSFSYDELISRLQKMKTEIRNRINISLKDISYSLDDITHYLEFSNEYSLSVRSKYEYLFLSLPENATPNIRDMTWVEDTLSYVYATYIVTLSQCESINAINLPFPLALYQIFLHIFGNRYQVESTLLDLISTARVLSEHGSIRLTLFLRFLGFHDPLPLYSLHFYLYCLVVISKIGSTRLFPRVEAIEEMIGGIAVSVTTQSAEKIIGRFVSGRQYKFYTERIEKMANGGFLKFGGRAIAELDPILEYLLNAYLEESHKIEEAVIEKVNILPSGQIWNFSDLISIAPALKTKPNHKVYSEIMVKCLREKSGFPIAADLLVKFFRSESLTVPFEFSKEDFTFEPSFEDIQPFVQSEFAFTQNKYNETIERLTKNGDELQVKQLKAAKVKFDQNLSGRSSFKMFENNVREFFEKLNLFQYL